MTQQDMTTPCVCGAVGMFHSGVGKHICQGAPKCGCNGFKASK